MQVGCQVDGVVERGERGAESSGGFDESDQLLCQWIVRIRGEGCRQIWRRGAQKGWW